MISEGPSNPRVTIAVTRQLNQLRNKAPDGVRIIINDADIFDIQAELEGPVQTPYEGGVFRCRLQLPNDFPNTPPKGYFITRIFHPNVSEKGEICVNTLKKDWNHMSWSFYNIFEVIKCLLIVPFPESALNEEAGKQFMEDYDSYYKYAKLMTDVHAQPKHKAQAPTIATSHESSSSTIPQQQQQQQQQVDTLFIYQTSSTAFMRLTKQSSETKKPIKPTESAADLLGGSATKNPKSLLEQPQTLISQVQRTQVFLPLTSTLSTSMPIAAGTATTTISSMTITTAIPQQSNLLLLPQPGTTLTGIAKTQNQENLQCSTNANLSQSSANLSQPNPNATAIISSSPIAQEDYPLAALSKNAYSYSTSITPSLSSQQQQPQSLQQLKLPQNNNTKPSQISNNLVNNNSSSNNNTGTNNVLLNLTFNNYATTYPKNIAIPSSDEKSISSHEKPNSQTDKKKWLKRI